MRQHNMRRVLRGAPVRDVAAVDSARVVVVAFVVFGVDVVVGLVGFPSVSSRQREIIE